MVEQALLAELLVLAWAQLLLEVFVWLEGPRGRCNFGFHVAL